MDTTIIVIVIILIIIGILTANLSKPKFYYHQFNLNFKQLMILTISSLVLCSIIIYLIRKQVPH